MAEESNGAQDPRQPYNLEAEQAVLGSLLLDGDAMVAVSPLLGPEDFYLEAHRVIYGALVALYERSAPLDYVSVLAELERQGALAKAGGRAYLLGLAPGVPTAYHAAHYAALVQQRATLRRLIVAGQKICAIGYDDTGAAHDAIARAEAEVYAVAQRQSPTGFVRLRDALADYLDHLELVSTQPGGVAGVPTGFLDLDRLLGGLQRSSLIMVAARPAMGKTSWALAVALASARRAQTRTALFSLEMGVGQLVERLLCMEGRFDSTRLRSGHVSEEEWSRITAAAGALAECPLYIDDSAVLTTADVRGKVRRLHQQEPLDLVIVDYLQLLRAPGRSENRVQEISTISRDLKALARELNVPVLALAQLNRNVEARADHRPLLSDLREGGSQEQDADVVAFLYREGVYHPETERPNVAEVIVAKNRHGPSATIELYWDAAHTLFRNLDHHNG